MYLFFICFAPLEVSSVVVYIIVVSQLLMSVTYIMATSTAKAPDRSGGRSTNDGKFVFDGRLFVRQIFLFVELVLKSANKGV